MNKLFLFCTVLFLSCASTQTMLIPMEEYSSYKHRIEVQGEKIVRADTVKATRTIRVYYQDR